MITLFLLFKILFVDIIKNLLGMYLGLGHLLSPTSKFLQQCGFSIGIHTYLIPNNEYWAVYLFLSIVQPT